ncbi:MAG: hypothetical protein KGJ07_05200 [Patescibacteria group bacterium]|nr:hypothetical protein [Patescibacteria group bacterium]
MVAAGTSQDPVVVDDSDSESSDIVHSALTIRDSASVKAVPREVGNRKTAIAGVCEVSGVPYFCFTKAEFGELFNPPHFVFDDLPLVRDVYKLQSPRGRDHMFYCSLCHEIDQAMYSSAAEVFEEEMRYCAICERQSRFWLCRSGFHVVLVPLNVL